MVKTESLEHQKRVFAHTLCVFSDDVSPKPAGFDGQSGKHDWIRVEFGGFPVNKLIILHS